MYSNFRIWIPVFEGEDDASGDAGAAAAAAASDAGADGAPPPGDDASNGDGKVVFDESQQRELNRIVAAEKKKHQAVTKKALDEALAMRSKATLTAKENQEADARIEQLRTELLTKEEQGKRAAEKARKAHKMEKDSLAAERDTWKNRFTESTIQRSLTDAAASNNAFSPKQIVAILGRDTQLVEVLDDDGKPTGVLEPKVRYRAQDKEGKPVTLDLTPAEAIKRMKDEEEYLNLFRGEGAGGAGLHSRPGGRKPDVAQTAKDPAAYRKARKDGTLNFQ